MRNNDMIEDKEDTIPEVFREAVLADDWDKCWGLVSRAVTNGAIDFLSKMAEKNPQSMHDLCEFRVPLQMSEDDPLPVMVMPLEGEDGFWFGILGIMNGIICTILDSNRLIAGAYGKDGKLVKFTPHIIHDIKAKKRSPGMSETFSEECYTDYENVDDPSEENSEKMKNLLTSFPGFDAELTEATKWWDKVNLLLFDMECKQNVKVYGCPIRKDL